MPSRPKSRKRYHEKKSRVRPRTSVIVPKAALPTEQPTSKAPETSAPSYAYVARDLRRIAVVTGIVLVILILLYIFLR